MNKTQLYFLRWKFYEHPNNCKIYIPQRLHHLHNKCRHSHTHYDKYTRFYLLRKHSTASLLSCKLVESNFSKDTGSGDCSCTTTYTNNRTPFGPNHTLENFTRSEISDQVHDCFVFNWPTHQIVLTNNNLCLHTYTNFFLWWYPWISDLSRFLPSYAANPPCNVWVNRYVQCANTDALRPTLVTKYI